ncbi:MAG: TolC family protein [Vicingaceae bacterium]
MKRFWRIPFALSILLVHISDVSGQNDSLTLTFNDFMNAVSEHHPMAYSARLKTEIGQANLQGARGAFDPKLYADISQKYFTGDQYYSLPMGGVKIPTWFGLEVEAGMSQNRGVYLNPENFQNSSGLYFAGVSLPVGQGLFIDQRRADLRKAQTMTKMAEVKQVLLLNELLFEAGKSYWQWFEAYNTVAVFQEALALASTRFEAVRQGAYLGDRPSIDTLEAGIQVQNRMLMLQQAQLELANSSLKLSVYLWLDGMVPLELSEDATPDPLTEIPLDFELTDEYPKLDLLINTHPELVFQRLNLDRLEIDRRWKSEQLKPVLNLKYNALADPAVSYPVIDQNWRDYQWGLEFNMPIFLRKERSSLRIADLYIRENEFELMNKQAGINAAVNMAFNEWNTTRDQFRLYRQNVNDSRGLLNGERQLFDGGESSLFMVNSRELAYINAQVKMIEIASKNQKSLLNAKYSLGKVFP